MAWCTRINIISIVNSKPHLWQYSRWASPQGNTIHFSWMESLTWMDASPSGRCPSLSSPAMPLKETVLYCYEPVRDDSAAFMTPQFQESVSRSYYIRSRTQHPLPDPREISQIEDIMELGWSRQQMVLLNTVIWDITTEHNKFCIRACIYAHINCKRREARSAKFTFACFIFRQREFNRKY